MNSGCQLTILIMTWLLLCPGNEMGAVTNIARADALFDSRQRMVHEQLEARGRDITNRQVLNAMATVPRHEFVATQLRGEAYADYPLPIGYGQTISQPFIVAYMSEQVLVANPERILEIGTGCGYQAAILSQLVKEVYTIEIIDPLAQQAEANLRRLGYTNVMIKAGDGYLGWPEKAPFDAIIVTCAPDHIPSALLKQLKEGGRMIIPVGTHHQELLLLEKRKGEVIQKAVMAVRFVPLTRKSETTQKTER